LAASGQSRADDRPLTIPTKVAVSLTLNVRNVLDPKTGKTEVAITIAEKTVDLKSLDSELATLVRAAKAFGIARDNITLAVRAEKDVSAGSVAQIISRAQKSGFKRFSLQVPEERQRDRSRPKGDETETKIPKKTTQRD
jgi:biopolymer transport protein ExbD